MDKRVYDLRVNNMTNPTGTDEKPMFSWKTQSDAAGAAQTAYRVIVSGSADFKTVLWDSGKIISDRQFGVEYGGELLPASRYFWRVILTDENGAEYESEPAYFETGLLCEDFSAWSGAQWIGAPYKTRNVGGVRHYKIDVDFEAENGRCKIVTAARSREDYFLIDIDLKSRRVRVYESSDNAWDGSRDSGVRQTYEIRGRADGYEIPESVILSGTLNSARHLTIEANKENLTLSINGKTIIDAQPLIPETSPIKPYRQRMFMFGFKQGSSCAVYDNLKIEALDGEPVVLVEDGFDNEYTNCSYLGSVKNGKLYVKNSFALTSAVPAIIVGTETEVRPDLKSARIYASARGVYDLFINGERVNKSFYNPGFTDYSMRIMYQTYDVTGFLKSGKNTISASVGSGYYSGFVGYGRMPMVYGEQNSFLAKIVLTYENGDIKTIVTDGSWKFTDCGPIVYDDYLNGEFYDARREAAVKNFASPVWKKCGVIPNDDLVSPVNGEFSSPVKFKLTAQRGPAAEIYARIIARPAHTCPDGHFVYDMGQNLVGTVKVTLTGRRGASVKLRYGEMCYKSGEIYLKNLRAAYNTDTYILRGGTETFVPSFASRGFRYVEISGDIKDGDVRIISVEGLAISSTREQAGGFECSDAGVNQLYRNIVWGQVGNSLLVYTDCPQRNERMGWTGDAQIFSRTAAYNMNIRAFTDKWLTDISDAQIRYNKNGAVPDTAPLGGDNRPDGCAGWGDASVIIPWEMYRAYGDIKILRDNYDTMQKWAGYLTSPERLNRGLRIVNGKPVPEKSDLADEAYIQVQQRRGDHLAFDDSTPFILTATAYSARTLKLMSRIAKILGKDGDSKMYLSLFGKIKRAFCQAWVKDDGSIAYWGEMSKDGVNETYYAEGTDNQPSQTAYAVALRFGLADGDTKIKMGAFLRRAVERSSGLLTTGFLGIAHLNPALTDTGSADAAYSLLLEDKNPSWLYSVKNGATTIWERWDSYIAETDTFGKVEMNSFNHYAYGAIGEWLFETVLGISPLKAGYKKVKIAPVIGGGLKYARGYHDSPYGRIESSWSVKDGIVSLRCTIPPNSSAVIEFRGETHEVPAGNYEFSYAEN